VGTAARTGDQRREHRAVRLRIRKRRGRLLRERARVLRLEILAQQRHGLTVDEVAEVTGWTADEVRELEASALAKLRDNPAARAVLEQYLGRAQ